LCFWQNKNTAIRGIERIFDIKKIAETRKMYKEEEKSLRRIAVEVGFDFKNV